MKMIKPIVKDVSLYREIVKNMINPLEVIREAISNSVDAEAKNIIFKIYRNYNGKFSIEIIDDGLGMDSNEIRAFFNLGDSYKDIKNIGEKGLGTKIFFRCEKLSVNSKKAGNVEFKAIMEKPWEKLKKGIMPSYQLDEISLNSNKQGTIVKIENYFVNNPEKYFNIGVLKDYIRWFTAGGSFKNIFANFVELNAYVKNMQVAPRIFIKDEILGVEEEIAGTHQFFQPQENPNIDETEKIYKRSVNYCRHFGPYHRSTNINGEYVSFQLYGTISGINCRKKIAKLRIGEKYKSRFGCYLAKDFIPIIKTNIVPYENFHHFHLLLNSQNFELTADRNNISNMDDDKVKWIIKNVKSIVNRDILPLAKAGYFKMRKMEEIEYISSLKYQNLDLKYEKSQLLNDLKVEEICLKKEPYNSFTTLFLLIAILSNKSYKKYIKVIRKIIFYSNDLIYRLCCEDKEGKVVIVAIEYQLSNILNSNILKGLNYIICWNVDLEVNNTSFNGLEIQKIDELYRVKTSDEIIDVIELSTVIKNIRLGK